MPMGFLRRLGRTAGDPGRVPGQEQVKIAGSNTARVYNLDVATLTVPA
jgi:hypothetical protein